jgi:hypothetical protein
MEGAKRLGGSSGSLFGPELLRGNSGGEEALAKHLGKHRNGTCNSFHGPDFAGNDP